MLLGNPCPRAWYHCSDASTLKAAPCPHFVLIQRCHLLTEHDLHLMPITHSISLASVPQQTHDHITLNMNRWLSKVTISPDEITQFI
ncbi:hypothetical protein AVEN_231222-1 [Araneus ventricosus]|uniref:Uncharacterized protein n=1 Tax=Araneus ventricosus TaxID=182803 RepID=A0A4Y2TDJ9_ARAVE|nr:hypothetical protein AVEN_231222-1 [Araneus ventricosus]